MSYPQPPTPYPPRAAGPAVTGIAVTASFAGAVKLSSFKPKILIDDVEVPLTDWGRNVIPARPGRRRVHVYVRYYIPSRFGPADTVVDVYPGTLTELEYAAPAWRSNHGSLGIGPQRYNGVSTFNAVRLGAVGLGFAIPVLFFVLYWYTRAH